MKNRIVVKLFLLTSLLCIFILIGVFFGQSIFFEKYYIKNKEENLIEATQNFKETYVGREGNEEQLVNLQQSFLNKNNAWISVLNEEGYVETNDIASMEIENLYISENGEYDYNNDTVSIPLMYMENAFNNNEQLSSLSEYVNHQIEVHGIQKGEDYYPYEIILSKDESSTELNTIRSSIDVIDNILYWKNDDLLEKVKQDESHNNLIYKNLYGVIKETNIPETQNQISSNQTLLDQLREFQSHLIFEDSNDDLTSDTIANFDKDGVSYKLIVDSDSQADGKVNYFVTLSSLQPIDEASGLLQEYYLYVSAVVLFLVLLVSFYYSKKITKPLITINNTAKKMANLDFKEEIVVKSGDEIGQLSESINTLSENLKIHIDQLNQDIEKEKQLEKVRKEFIAGVSHELKTPLSVMKSCISIIEDGVAEEKKDYYFEAMQSEVDRMDQLIVDMLELAKFESGTYTLALEEHDLSDLVHNVYNQLFIELQKKDLQLILDVVPIKVWAHSNRIGQVLTNFLTNAIQHTPRSGRITISTLKKNNRVRISVENEGDTIQVDQLQKLWDRFYQENKTHRSKEGSGLGLAISKNILELHRSQYGVTNTDHGVCFFFYLNVVEE